MFYTIHNSKMTIQINSLGAQLWSVKDTEGREYLWQGDESYWRNRATNLFPFCGRQTEGKYQYQGKTYEMMIHGFAKQYEYTVAEHSGQHLVLSLAANEETKAMYPFDFEYRVHFTLEEKTLKICYEVQNTGNSTMYFALGGHPGFFVPMEEGLSYDDYEVQFEKERIEKVVVSPEYFVTEETIPAPEIHHSVMKLAHSLFDNDAIILKDAGTSVILHSPKATKKLRVTYPDMKFLAFWHTPQTDAPFLCIEPWTSLPARQGVIEDLEKKSDLVALPSGQSYQNHWSMEWM